MSYADIFIIIIIIIIIMLKTDFIALLRIAIRVLNKVFFFLRMIV